MVICVNLMGESKKEQILNDAFKGLLDANNLSYVKYEHIDFYEVCNGKYDRINPHIRSLEKNALFLGAYCYNSNT